MKSARGFFFRDVRPLVWRSIALRVATVFVIAGCATGEMPRREGVSLIEQGRYEEGLAMLEKATHQSPENIVLRKDYLRQRELVINKVLSDASNDLANSRSDAAEARFRRVLGIDPGNVAARQGLEAIEVDRRHVKLMNEAQGLINKGDLSGARALLSLVAVEDPSNARLSLLRQQIEAPIAKDSLSGPTLNIKGRKPVTLQFRDANLKMVLEAISRTTGVNILLDKDVRNDIKVTIFVKDTPVEETLDLILLQNQLEKRVLGENTVLIYPFNPAKSKDYQELKVRRFALVNADPKQVQNMIKTILKTKDVFVDEKSNAVVIRDAPQVIRLAEKLVASMDQAEPEVMLEVELLDVNRNRSLDLGVDWPTSVSVAYTGATDIKSIWNRKPSDISVTPGPGFSVAFKALETDGDTRVLATPRIRARNKEKAKIMIGSRTPVISSAATTTAGATSAVYNTNIQYLDTGIKLEVEPTVYLDGDVAIKLNLEISDLGDKFENQTTGTLAYATTTNNATTVLRLKDGETQVMAGLLRAFNSNGAKNKVPGLGDIPLIGRLFGIQSDQWQNREIVLAITPHIIRNGVVSDADMSELWSGTESNIKAAAPNLRVSGTSGVLGQSTGAAAPAASLARPTPSGAPRTTTVQPPVVAGPLTMTLAGPQQAKVGDKINVIVNAQGTGVGSVNFVLRYDTEALKAVGVSEGDLMRKGNVKGAFDGQIDEAGGSVTADLSAEGGATVASANGGVAVVQFEVIGGNGPVSVSIAGATAAGTAGAATTVTTPPPFIVTVQGQ